MAKKKSMADKPHLVLRSVRTIDQEQFGIAEVWDQGESFLGVNYVETSAANVSKLNRKQTSAPENATKVKFNALDDAQVWFTQFLEVANDEWLDVWTKDIRGIEPWIIEGLKFADNETVDVVELAQSFDDIVEEWALERLESIPLVWKPVRVAGRLIVGFTLESGEVAYFAFDDDSGQFGFQKDLANFSWFMDSNGAPISWNGGKEIGFVNETRGLLAESNSGDYEEPFDVWELKPEWNVASSIAGFFIGNGDDSAEHILFLELGVERGEGVFTDEEWSLIKNAIDQSQDEASGWMGCWVTPEYRREVGEMATEKSKLFKAMHEFFTDPGFEYRDVVLDSWNSLVEETSSFAWAEVFLRGSRAYVTPRDEL